MTGADGGVVPDGADTEPTFAEPWEARAFALAVALRDGGHLAWPAFQARLAIRIAADPAGSTGYYEHWLGALEDVTGAATPVP